MGIMDIIRTTITVVIRTTGLLTILDQDTTLVTVFTDTTNITIIKLTG